MNDYDEYTVEELKEIEARLGVNFDWFAAFRVRWWKAAGYLPDY